MSKKKVLIVDDEEGICDFMKDMFERKSCQAFISLDTEEALDIFKREKPHVCIIDVHMPFSKFDGVELLRKIREIDKEAKCVIISRIDDSNKVEEAKSLGVYKYIFKPSSPEEIEKLVEELSQ